MPSFKPDPSLLKKYPNAVTLPQLQQKERFLGTLLGLAAGEALGTPYQFQRAGELAKKAPGGPREIVAGGKWAAGEPSDDVDLTLAVLRSLVARRGLELSDVAAGFVKWLGNNPKHVGKLTRASIENLRAGEGHEQSGAMAWEDAGRSAAGNGSVSWCAPIGLFHSKDTERLAEDATALSRITHFDPRCVGGCIAVATAVSLLVRGDKDAEEAIPRAAAAGGAVSDEVLAVIERGANKKPDQLHVDGDDNGYVLHTLELAFSALASASTFEEGVVAVVARGGDTDTNGSVAGALLGAKFGKTQVPERWVKLLKAAPELINLGEQLHKQL